MRLFAIGDLHMSGGDDKPMDVFGPQWDRHFFHIRENWQQLVTAEDTVLIPGDISWAMQLEAARADLEEIGRLPGKKILCKGAPPTWAMSWSAAPGDGSFPRRTRRRIPRMKRFFAGKPNG